MTSYVAYVYNKITHGGLWTVCCIGKGGVHMNIWKILAICGAGVAIILLFAGIGTMNAVDRELQIIAGVGAANFTMLALILDRLDKGAKK